MARKKRPQHEPKSFESTGKNFTNPATGHIQTESYATIYESMLMNPMFQNLLPRQQVLYLLCKAQYYGKRKPNRDYPDVEEFKDDACFYMNKATVQRYNLYAQSTKGRLYEDMEALIAHGFVDRVMSGKATHEKTVYKLSDRWWTDVPDVPIRKRTRTKG